jgi:tRNA(Ile)-lysidine synthase
MRERIEAFIREHDLLPPGARVLVAASGGADSSVLAEILHASGFAVTLAHVNYKLRGEDSDADEASVRSLTERLRCGLEVCNPEPGELESPSLHDAARTVRYAFFLQVARRLDIQYVAVGHHVEDQAESVLLQLGRGTGIEGLAGMAPARELAPGVVLIRPLLSVRRQEIESFAQEQGIPYRADASNADPRFGRARVRQTLLPALEKALGEDAAERIAFTASLVREYLDDTWRRSLERRAEECLTPFPGAAGAVHTAALLAQPPAWRRRVLLEALQRFLPQAPRSRRALADLEALASAQPGKRWEVATGAVWRERDVLVFVPNTDAGFIMENPMDVAPGKTIRVGGGRLRAFEPHHRRGACPAPGPYQVCFDVSRLPGPMRVRAWQEGDRIAIGGGRHKNVSDVLSEVGVPAFLRAEVPVLVAGEEVVWIPGCRRAPVGHPGSGEGPVVCVTFLPETNWISSR